VTIISHRTRDAKTTQSDILPSHGESLGVEQKVFNDVQISNCVTKGMKGYVLSGLNIIGASKNDTHGCVCPNYIFIPEKIFVTL
jgi:hypothetical protein